jgi:conjugative transfer pilus assembly protein TraH
MKRLLVVCVFAFLPCLVSAGVNSDLANFFSGVGMKGKTSNPAVYESQAGGHVTGGSLFMRDRIKNLKIVNIDTPSYSAGCGGINAYFGSFSFVGADQIVEFGKSLMSNAAGYGFQLALNTTVPQISETMSSLRDLVTKVNNFNMNSCETAQALVGGLAPKTKRVQEEVCKDLASGSGQFKDWAAGRQQCASQDQMRDKMQQAKGSAGYSTQVIYNVNVIWDNLKHIGLVSEDRELAEAYMSLSGTIVSKGDGTSDDIRFLGPLMTNEDALSAMLHGGKLNLYRCDEASQCLNPSIQEVTINENSALSEAVRQKLDSIITKVQTDTELSTGEKDLIGRTSIPIYKFIIVAANNHLSPHALGVDQYAELIAVDLLSSWMKDAVSILESSALGSQYIQEVRTQIEGGIHDARRFALNFESKAHEKIQDRLAMVRDIDILEKKVSSGLSEELKVGMNTGE